MAQTPIPLPESLSKVIGPVEWHPITVGLSDDDVWRLTGESVRYLKIGRKLKGEASRLRWLCQYLPVPEVHHFGVYKGREYLLMSAIEGEMVHEIDLPPQRRVELMGEALRMFHEVPRDDCPFDWSLERQLEAAWRNIEDWDDDEWLDEPYTGMEPSEAFAELMTELPHETEDLVVVHGDYCLPNILIDPATERITGFIDLGRSGVADRYTDIAVGARSILFNLGEGWTDLFLEAYGIDDVDLEKMMFYRRIDNFN